MTHLYPLKFTPTAHEKIWGGNRLQSILNKNFNGNAIGESWEVSDIEGSISIINNGELKGKSFKEVIQDFKSDLVGINVWKKFGENFPLLIKFIDAKEPLSVQVHPNDELAKPFNSFGKSEMWYIIDAQENSEIILGFKEKITPNDFLKHIKNESLDLVLKKIKVQKDDVFYVPAGRLHAIGSGILLVEIQQKSDITYRVYDYNRIDQTGNKRELNVILARDAINFSDNNAAKEPYHVVENQLNPLINTPFFTTQIFKGKTPFSPKLTNNSFTIFVCTQGNGHITYNDKKTPFSKGETIFIPAIVTNIKITPTSPTVLLSASYID